MGNVARPPIDKYYGYDVQWLWFFHIDKRETMSRSAALNMSFTISTPIAEAIDTPDTVQNAKSTGNI